MMNEYGSATRAPSSALNLSLQALPPGMDNDMPSSPHNHSGEWGGRNDLDSDGDLDNHGGSGDNEDWLEHLSEWAVLPDKCVIIQKSLKRATAAEIEYCFSVLKQSLVTFARDQVGNHTLQSLLKHCTAEQLTVALPILFRVDSIVELSCDQFSNHVLQQYLQQAPAELLIKAVEVIYANHHSLLKMACDRIGNHVIQCCVKVNPSNLNDLTSVLADDDILPLLSTHHFGNHVLRCVIENELSDKLRQSLWKHWGKLSFDKYGNLCIQKFISKIPPTDLVVHAGELANKLTQLATHRFANHVLQAYVDQAVRHANKQTVSIIVGAMKQGFFELATDQFGSFVVCTALAAFEDEASTPLVDFCVQGSNICKIARTQYGCQLLQKWIDVASEVQLRRISVALSACFAAVSRDKFGNHFCLKMMSSRAASVVNRNAGAKGLSQLIMNIATLAEHQHASHVVQRIVEVQVWSQLDTDAKTDVAAAIGKNLPRLARHKLGVHVARKAFSVVFMSASDRHTEQDKLPAIKLCKALEQCFLQVALDQHGCRLFEACIRCGHAELTDMLVAQCCANINRLSRHTFGGLSVRAVLNGCKGSAEDRGAILHRICDALAPHSVTLARDRQGNLVLQAAIRATKAPRSLAEALMPHSVPLCLDWFGNRVVQRLLECLPRDGPLFLQLTERIQTHKDELEGSKYGKFVLSTIEKGEFPVTDPSSDERQAYEDMGMMPPDMSMQGSPNFSRGHHSGRGPNKRGARGRSNQKGQRGSNGRHNNSDRGKGGRSNRSGNGNGHRSGRQANGRNNRQQGNYHNSDDSDRRGGRGGRGGNRSNRGNNNMNKGGPHQNQNNRNNKSMSSSPPSEFSSSTPAWANQVNINNNKNGSYSGQGGQSGGHGNRDNHDGGGYNQHDGYSYQYAGNGNPRQHRHQQPTRQHMHQQHSHHQNMQQAPFFPQHSGGQQYEQHYGKPGNHSVAGGDYAPSGSGQGYIGGGGGSGSGMYYANQAGSYDMQQPSGQYHHQPQHQQQQRQQGHYQQRNHRGHRGQHQQMHHHMHSQQRGQQQMHQRQASYNDNFQQQQQSIRSRGQWQNQSSPEYAPHNKSVGGQGYSGSDDYHPRHGAGSFDAQTAHAPAPMDSGPTGAGAGNRQQSFAVKDSPLLQGSLFAPYTPAGSVSGANGSTSAAIPPTAGLRNKSISPPAPSTNGGVAGSSNTSNQNAHGGAGFTSIW